MKTKLIYLAFLILFSTFLKAQNNEEAIYKKANENIEKYRKDDFSVQITGASDFANIQVEVEQISHEFLFGCILFDLIRTNETPENENLFKERFKNLFNFAVFPFYWASYETQPGLTKKEDILKVVQWCKENNIKTKGHPLVWTHTAGTPHWLKDFPAPATRELLQTRVEKIVSEFEGEIEIWDVINEVIHTVNWEVAMKENAAGEDNRYTGKDLMMERVDFIDSCFQWANKANPEAHLIINEFNVVASEKSRADFYKVVEKLLNQNSPVHGLGIQVHEPYKGRYYYSPQQLWETYETYAAFNLPLHVTELIPVSNGDEIMGDYKSGVWTEEVQAQFAEMVYVLSFGHPDMQSINWWGFTDKHIWQENGGLTDNNLQAKKVYHTLDRLINREWKTKIKNLIPDENGQVNFRGFKGDYKITVLKNGEPIKESALKYNETNRLRIEL
jgi:GH35 family endo-1,4-beta-xylanase